MLTFDLLAYLVCNFVSPLDNESIHNLPLGRDMQREDDPVQRGVIRNVMTDCGHGQCGRPHPRRVRRVAHFEHTRVEVEG